MGMVKIAFDDDSATPPARSADDEPARTRPGWPGCGTSPRRFPRSPHTDRRGRCPTLPLQHRHEYAAVLPRGLPTDVFKRLRSRPATLKGWPGVHCSPAHIRQVGAGVPLKGLYTLVSHVHLPVLLARPESSGSTDSSCRCQGCSHPHRRLPGQAALSFTRPLRRPSDGVLPPPFGNAAPRGARKPPCRQGAASEPPRHCAAAVPNYESSSTSATERSR